MRPRLGERQGCEGLRPANRKPVSAQQAKAQFSALIDPAAAVYLSVVSRITPVGFKPPKRRCRRH